ncbi:sarcosine oxidase subunit gamma [Candidatus Pelagibacter sp.]|nr:sarcosine oxidase subunit gamma [Candidatus Pelagibacter sp.]
MLNYNSPINNQINFNEITVKELSPVMKLNLRGKKREFFTTVGKQLDMILPTEANTSSSSSKLTSIWLSPDEWLVVSNDLAKKNSNKYDLEENLYNSISKTNLGAVVDVTDQLVMLELEGSKIYELFSSGSPFNFNEFRKKKGSTTQTLLNNIDVIIQNKNKNLVNLLVRRSFSQHLFSWINDACKNF